MTTILGARYASFSILSLTLGAGGLSAYGCSTTAVNGTADGGGSGSSSGGASSSSSSGGASSSSGGSGSSGGSSSGSSGGVVDAGPITCSAKVPSADGGPFVISDFSSVTANDAGTSPTTFGTYPGYFGGTYFFPSATPTVAGPGLPGTDQLPNPDAGNYCTQPLSQNSFVAAVVPASKSWVLSGTVAGFSGVGFYIQSAPVLCVDASAYKGVSFTISGTIGSAGDAAADAGTSQVTFKAFEAADRQVAASGPPGACTTGSACNPPSYSFALPATPTTMTIHWTDLTGGVPDPTLSDPSTLSGIEWDLPWPCTGGAPYPVNITIQDVQFVTQ